MLSEGSRKNRVRLLRKDWVFSPSLGMICMEKSEGRSSLEENRYSQEEIFVFCYLEELVTHTLWDS
jgi:hypothetical protein